RYFHVTGVQTCALPIYGRLGQAALDVYESEPTSAARWADVPNTVLTPHTGGATQEAVQAMLGLLTANLAAFFAGEPVKTPAVARSEERRVGKERQSASA